MRIMTATMVLYNIISAYGFKMFETPYVEGGLIKTWLLIQRHMMQLHHNDHFGLWRQLANHTQR